MTGKEQDGNNIENDVSYISQRLHYATMLISWMFSNLMIRFKVILQNQQVFEQYHKMWLTSDMSYSILFDSLEYSYQREYACMETLTHSISSCIVDPFVYISIYAHLT